VYEAHRATDEPELAIMSVHHKASVEESGGDDGVTWWSRACNTDREAIILLDSTDAERLLQNAEHYRRPPKPRSPPLYCYIGCGLDRQPTCITGIVARTARPALTAAVATACRILGLNFPGETSSMAVAEDRIAAGDWPTALQDLLARLDLSWGHWAGIPPQTALACICMQFTGTPQNLPILPPVQDASTIAVRLCELVSLPRTGEDLLDWGGDDDI
jgi:hypothetical protein